MGIALKHLSEVERIRIAESLFKAESGFFHNEKHFDDEDTVKDLIKYLILLLIAKGES